MNVYEKAEALGPLQEQLSRQLDVQRRHGIKAHEIRNIRLIPRGRGRDGRIVYGSVVTMRSGEELFLPESNIKEELDGGQMPAVF